MNPGQLIRFATSAFGKRTENKFAFVLCPPYCGSTLLTQILASSKNVSINNANGTCEGQTLPQVRDLMFVEDRWDENLVIDWPHVKQIWEQHWDLRKPILLEKSPPNLLRGNQIVRHFRPVHFFAMWRNPYAHCESQIRRNGNCPREAAGFAVRCLNLQRQNIEQFDNLLPISYENLASNPAKFVQQATEFLPELGKMNISGDFDVHNFLGQKLSIQDLNREKIEALTSNQRSEITAIFRDNRETLNYFGYRTLR